RWFTCSTIDLTQVELPLHACPPIWRREGWACLPKPGEGRVRLNSSLFRRILQSPAFGSLLLNDGVFD
ncbi:MAG: hypothetical protein RIA63_09385, partial [Cyclobacteriaceae bacterium]